MKKLLTLVFMLASLLMFGQGSTTSSMKGYVSDQSNVPLIGVNVVAVHTPSGSFYGTSTNVDGSFRIDNMKVGGPYTITISYVGSEDVVTENVFLRLGESYTNNFQMGDGSVGLDEVLVTANAGNLGTRSGTSTNISAQQIEDMPTLGRNLSDFTRLTPQSKSTFGGGTSIGGQNNRFNAIYVDGAVNNDVFGLAANGQNGGQTGIAPFSIDAIDQIQVVLSPFDVSYGGFSGGGISAVTKSGTNCFTGSAYYFNQNENLAGKTPGKIAQRLAEADGVEVDSIERTKLAPFSKKLYGVSLGGPIVKDKAFFFINAEIQRDENPVPFSGLYNGDSTFEELDALQSFLQNTYGYDAGEYGDKTSRLDGTRIFAKLDFNLGKSHNLTLRHNYTKGENTSVNGSTDRSINFANNGVFFPTTTNSSAIELNSRFGSSSNNLIIGYTTVRDDRDPIGMNFPNVRIDDGAGSIFLGSEAFSTANALDQNVLTITNNFKLYKGDHTITIGTHNEFISFYNLFIRQNFGSYRFGSLDDFYGGIVSEFDRSYSLVDDVTGDGSAAAADFSAAQFGVYIQDAFSLSNKFTLTGGIRLDIPVLNTDPSIDPSFNTTTLPLLAANYDLQGAEGGQAPSGQLLVSPRLGFNYIADEGTILRGGIGIFTSRVPFVWPGGMYTNNGLTVGGLTEDDLTSVTFNPDPQSQPVNPSPDASDPSGQVDLFTKDFKYPQVLRASIGFDKSIGNGWSTTLEAMYTKTLNNVFYTNVNSDPTVAYNWSNGADDRPIFTRTSLDPTYTAIYLASNTSEGYSYNLTGSINKNFDSGLSLFAAYSYGDARSLFDGTSSQNSSQWRGTFTTDGRNNPALGTSDFALGSRVIASAGYKFDWTNDDNFSTTLSMFYNGQSGDLYSYVYNNRNVNNETGSTSRERHLIYVPIDQNDISLVDGDLTASEQWALLDNFINEDDYLSTRRGMYAETNGSRTPFTHQFDLRIAQNLGVNLGGVGNRLQLTLDIFNVGNLINKNWGVLYGNPFAYRLIDIEGIEADGTTPTFSFSEELTGKERFGINDNLSRWRGRIGLRYTFGGANECSSVGVSPMGISAGDKIDKKSDRDGDGIKDFKDACPDTPGTKKFAGCPMSAEDMKAKAEAEAAEARMQAEKAAQEAAEAKMKAEKAAQEAAAAKMAADMKAKKAAEAEAKAKADAEAKEMKAKADAAAKVERTKMTEINASFNAALKGIQFNSSKSTFKTESYVLMDDVVSVMQKYPNLKVSIEGHTDSQGKEETNSQLSVSRANAVKTYLVSKGIESTRLSTRGFGEAMPVADNNTAVGRAQNRRVEFKIVK